MLPNPLHPAIVHFPIVLMVLLPFAVAFALVDIYRHSFRRQIWAGIVAVNLLLVLSGGLALNTGAREEDRVETVVAERHIEAHEEAAELFVSVSVLVLVLSGLGLLRGRIGSIGRIATAVASVVLLVLGIRVGDAGGKLVYKYGAAQAYTQSQAQSRGVPVPEAGREEDEDD